MSKYFTFAEMIQSHTAMILGLYNKPNEQESKNLFELMEVLDSLREKWGSPILVSSGFRCKELNAAVGGSKTSAHMIGYAADLIPKNRDFEGFFQCAQEWATTHEYDQLIVETDSKGSQWLHLGLFNSKHQQRHQNKTLEKKPK